MQKVAKELLAAVQKGQHKLVDLRSLATLDVTESASLLQLLKRRESALLMKLASTMQVSGARCAARGAASCRPR